MIVPPKCTTPVRVRDMNHDLASTEELRARCADVFYGPVSPSSSLSSGLQKQPSPLRIKKIKREVPTLAESRSPKRAKTSHGPEDGKASDEVKQWFASNLAPDSSSYRFVLKRSSEKPPHKDINWLVTINAQDLSTVHNF